MLLSSLVSLLLTAAPVSADVAQLDELARGRSWNEAPDHSCKGKATPVAGRTMAEKTYLADAIWQDVQLTLGNYSTGELGFLEPSRWKRLGRYEVRTYRSAAPRNVYYTFSIDTASHSGTTVCAVIWKRG